MLTNKKRAKIGSYLPYIDLDRNITEYIAAAAAAAVDFGLALTIEASLVKTKGWAGTQGYIAPECFGRTPVRNLIYRSWRESYS